MNVWITLPLSTKMLEARGQTVTTGDRATASHSMLDSQIDRPLEAAMRVERNKKGG